MRTILTFVCLFIVQVTVNAHVFIDTSPGKVYHMITQEEILITQVNIGDLSELEHLAFGIKFDPLHSAIRYNFKQPQKYYVHNDRFDYSPPILRRGLDRARSNC